MTKYNYAVIGAGMQGTAAAYDLAKFGDAEVVFLCDSDLKKAMSAAKRVRNLLGEGHAHVQAKQVAADNPYALITPLKDVNSCLSAAPYYLNRGIAQACLNARVHFNDLGGNTEIVQEELALHQRALEKGISIVPDCGLAPGMSNTLAVYGMSKMQDPKHVLIKCGGLPKNRNLPLGYKKLFSLDGLTNEYSGKAVYLYYGKIVEVDTLQSPEYVEDKFPDSYGTLEAFTTSGGTSTCPQTFEGKLETYEYKTLRYAKRSVSLCGESSHYEAMKVFKDLGFFSEDVIHAGDLCGDLTAREAFQAIMDKVFTHPKEPDVVLLRVDVYGEGEWFDRDHYWIRIVDEYDPTTGFSAMERCTAFPAAIVTAMQAQGLVAPGAVPLEKSVDPVHFMQELSRRGIKFEEGFEVAT